MQLGFASFKSIFRLNIEVVIRCSRSTGVIFRRVAVVGAKRRVDRLSSPSLDDASTLISVWLIVGVCVYLKPRFREAGACERGPWRISRIAEDRPDRRLFLDVPFASFDSSLTIAQSTTRYHYFLRLDPTTARVAVNHRFFVNRVWFARTSRPRNDNERGFERPLVTRIRDIRDRLEPVVLIKKRSRPFSLPVGDSRFTERKYRNFLSYFGYDERNFLRFFDSEDRNLSNSRNYHGRDFYIFFDYVDCHFFNFLDYDGRNIFNSLDYDGRNFFNSLCYDGRNSSRFLEYDDCNFSNTFDYDGYNFWCSLNYEDLNLSNSRDYEGCNFSNLLDYDDCNF